MSHILIITIITSRNRNFELAHFLLVHIYTSTYNPFPDMGYEHTHVSVINRKSDQYFNYKLRKRNQLRKRNKLRKRKKSRKRDKLRKRNIFS